MVALQRKNPMVGRTFWGLLSVVGVLMGNQKATAQSDPWDVDTLVAGALNQPEIQAVFQETVRAKRAEIAQRTMWQNPVLEAGYGHIVGPKESREVEFSVSVEQSFDMSSWRGRLWDTLPHHEAALASEVDHWRVEVTGLVRAAFFAVRYHEERVKIFETWSKRIETGLETMRTRENRGDVSRYDVLRIEAERESIQLNAAQEKILLAAAWAELRLWIPQENIRSIVGPLAPSQTLGGDRKELPALRRLENLSLVAHQETKVWGSPFLRGWTVGAGYRLLDTEQATGHGFLVTLSVPLIFSNVDEPIVEELNAEANAIDHQLQLQKKRVNHERKLVDDRLKTVFEELNRVQSMDTAGDLSRLAEVAYGAGEISVAELLDAYSNEAERGLLRVDLEWEARRAVLHREQLNGAGAVQ